MRQRLGWLVLVALMVPSLAALAQTEESFLDRFNAVSYSGNDGSLDWSGSWVESGESDGPSAGQVRVDDGLCNSGTCLAMSGGTLEEVGVHRKANLSGFLDARLHFQAEIAPALLSTGLFYVEVRGGGSGWTIVADYVLLTDGGSHSESIDISRYIGSDFGVRYRLVGMLGGDSVYIDDVGVIGHVPTTTTTTTTTTTSTTTPTTTTEATTSTIGTSESSSTTSTSTTVSRSTSDTATDERDRDQSENLPGDDARDDPGEGGEAESETTEPLASVSGTRPPPGGGIRAPVVGLMADYRPGVIAGTNTDEVEVLGVEVEADFSLAVEAFEEARLWLAILSLIIAAALVGGMDRRRSKADLVG